MEALVRIYSRGPSQRTLKHARFNFFNSVSKILQYVRTDFVAQCTSDISRSHPSMYVKIYNKVIKTTSVSMVSLYCHMFFEDSHKKKKIGLISQISMALHVQNVKHVFKKKKPLRHLSGNISNALHLLQLC